MSQENFSLCLYCTCTVFCTKPQRRLYILNVKLEATGQPSGWGAEGNVSFYYLYLTCSVDREQHIHSDKGAKGCLEGSEVRCFTVRVTEVWKALSSQPLLNSWLCFPRRLCFSEWQCDCFRGLTHTLDVKPYFGKPPPTSAIVRHAFRHSWHVYLMPIIDLFFLFPRVFWVDGVHRLRLLCYVPTLQTETRFLLMHFPVSLVIQIFEATNTGVINQTEEEQSQPQQVLRGNHLSSCEAGFAVCVCVIIKLFMAS